MKSAREAHLDIMDVLTPFPVHGLDPVLGLTESRIGYLCFIYGAIGCLFGFGFMSWVVASDWPILFGGKPYWPIPAYIPITFEMTVLFSAWGMTITFYTICGMWPGIRPKIIDNRITDDKFCIAFDVSEADKKAKDGLQAFFSNTGAAEVHEKEL